MVKRNLNIGNIFLFLFLAIFPFGQIIRMGIVQPLDLIVGSAAFYTILAKLKKPSIFKYFENFLVIAIFSWTVGASLFLKTEVFYGLLYLLRFAAYSYFLIYVWNFAKKSKSNKTLLINAMELVSIISAVFGWVQYFVFPSLRAFMVWGWDEHLFRLVGTFLDPTFLGIILVFGILISIYKYLTSKNKTELLSVVFLSVSLAFTYSRASYLALFAGLLVLAYYKKIFKKVIMGIAVFVALMLLLPTKDNTILKFTREFSAIARIENYSETLRTFKISPVFGVGYDNLCIAKSVWTGSANFASHACSGSDSSLLFILATTGIAGIIVLFYSIWNIGKSVLKSPYLVLISSASTALFIHSFFSNSLVYPWVLGYLLILLAVNLGSET